MACCFQNVFPSFHLLLKEKNILVGKKVAQKPRTTPWRVLIFPNPPIEITYLAGLFPWSERWDGIGGVRALHSASYELDLGSRKRLADGIISYRTFRCSSKSNLCKFLSNLLSFWILKCPKNVFSFHNIFWKTKRNRYTIPLVFSELRNKKLKKVCQKSVVWNSHTAPWRVLYQSQIRSWSSRTW